MNLIDAMRAHYSQSKRLLYWQALPISLGIYAAALLASLPLPNRLTGLLAVATMAAQIAVFILRLVALNSLDVAEGIRRMGMLQDGMGIPPSPVQLAKLQERTAKVTTEEVTLIAPYYDSQEPPGPRRLLDITAESAFFSRSLARRVWKQFGLIAGVGMLVPVLTILIAVLGGTPQTVLEVVARAVVASMAFWAAGDIAMMALQFFQLSQDSDRVLHQCEVALSRPWDDTGSEALATFTEYNCAVAKAPPIPFRAYRVWGDALNDAWKQRRAAPGPASTGTNV